MNIMRPIVMCVLTATLVGCATPRYMGNSDNAAAIAKESDTKLGVRYLLGRGVPQSDERAFHYFLAAARDNDPFAQNEVAYLYAAGKGTERNDEKAFEYYQKAANNGLASAQYNLGLFYQQGIGVEKNDTLAMSWFQKSSAHGFEPAKKALSKIQSNVSVEPTVVE